MFKDLGLPQKYSCLQIIKSVQNNSVVFDLITKSGIKPDWIPSDVEIADITNIKFVCDASNSQHKVNFKCLINFKEEIDTSIFVQKVSIMIINKIINRLKQFIENVRI
jgi:two-component SAPR family response regulator